MAKGSKNASSAGEGTQLMEGPVAAGDAAPSRAITRAVEAILLSTEKAVSVQRLAMVLSEVHLGSEGARAESGAEADESDLSINAGTIRRAVETLNAEYEATGRVFRIEALAGGYRLMTIPEMARVLEAFHGAREKAALSRAALETLAIIAYKQPITRAQLEAVRGVACGEILRSLTDRRLVTVVGRAEELGRPLVYGTTRAFLEAFGLSSIRDLPTMEEFRARTEADEEEVGETGREAERPREGAVGGGQREETQGV